MKKFYLLFAAFVCACSFYSCSDSDDPVKGENEEDVNPDPQTLVFTYDKFLQENDVQIAASDTSKILVNKEYLKANDIKINVKQDSIPLVVWRTIDTAPFVRQVIKTVDKGNQFELTTIHGDLGDVFPDSEFNLETDLHVDPTQSRTIMTRSGRSTVNPNRYVDEDGDIHPAVYILEEEFTELDENGNPMNPTRAGGPKVLTAEDLYADNADFRILNIDHRFKNKDFKLYDKDDVLVKFYAKDMRLKANAGLRINVNTRWFRLKYFECVAYGNIAGQARLGFLATAEKEIDLDKELARFGSYTSVFWVGIIPVAVNVKMGLRSKGSVDLSAKCDIYTKLDFYANFEAGAEYSGGWRSVLRGGAGSEQQLNMQTEVELGAETEVAALVYTDVSLYGCGGPGVELGPKVNAEANASMKGSASTTGDNKMVLSASYKTKVSMIGDVNAHLRIWKWSIGHWYYPFTLWESKTYSGSWEKTIN